MVYFINMTKHDPSLPHIHIDYYPKLVREGVFIIDDEVWSTQRRIARIYGRSIPTINDHLKKIYKEKELMKASSERALMVTQQEGKKKVSRKTYVYNTDVVIAIGFRVKGEWGKEFRIWARETVRASYNPKDQIKHLMS